jgi:hypothetical protein
MVHHSAPGRSASGDRAGSTVRRCIAATIAVACAAFGLASPARAATANMGTPIFSANLSSGTVTGEKPQSKLWYHDGSWWAILHGPNGVAFYEKLGDVWYRGAFMDAVLASSGEADVKWDGQRLMVLVYATTSQYFEYTYDASLRVWNLVPGFPVAVPRPSGSETMVMETDSAGRAWITAEGNNAVNVYYTTSADRRTWSKNPVVLRTGLAADDICSIIAFGGDKIGVFWSDQNRDEFGFRIHRDGDAPTDWQAQEVANAGPGYADDHIHLTADSHGRVYAITKDDFDRMTVVRREVDGSWTRRQDVTGGIGTRGIIMISEADAKAYILWTNWTTSPDRITYRAADLESLDFQGPSVLLMSQSSSLNNVTGTKQVLPGGCLLAVAEGASKVWSNGWGTPAQATLPAPAAPQDLIAELAESPARVQLAWSEPTSGTPEGYILYRSLNSGAFVRLVPGLLTQPNYTDLAIAAGTYTYKVSAFANQQEGPVSGTVSVTYTPAPPAAPSAPQSLVATLSHEVIVAGAAAWGFDDAAGQTAADATGYGHTGQLGTKNIADTSDPVWTAGITAGALRFDGSNDHVRVADAADLHFNSSFTVEAWVKRSSLGAEDCIVSKGDSGRRNYWLLFDTLNRIDFRWQNTSGKDHGVRTTLPFADLGWHHVAGVYDQAAGQSRIYYDGHLVQSLADSGVPATSTDALFIGAKITSGSVKAQFHGTIDLVRVSPSAAYTSDFAPPTSFNQSAQTVVQLAWQAPATGIATGYLVDRMDTDSTFVRLTPSPVAATTWVDTAPPAGDACYRVSAIDADAQLGPPSETACVTIAVAKAAPPTTPEPEAAPVQGGLELGAGPNPFNPTTTIHFRLAEAGPVRCTVYDVRGARVATLLDERRPAGEQRIDWNASGVASGAYFLVVQAAGVTEKQKLILLK